MKTNSVYDVSLETLLKNILNLSACWMCHPYLLFALIAVETSHKLSCTHKCNGKYLTVTLNVESIWCSFFFLFFFFEVLFFFQITNESELAPTWTWFNFTINPVGALEDKAGHPQSQRLPSRLTVVENVTAIYQPCPETVTVGSNMAAWQTDLAA